MTRADAAGRDRGLALGEHARLRRADAGDVADRVDAGELRLERQRVDRDPAVDGHARFARPPPAPGAPARRGRGRTASRRRRRASPPGAPGRAAARASAGASRSRARRTRPAAPSTRRATAGSGAGSGMTSEICERSRSPRSVRKSCISSAVSLGAGGHLNGVEVTATMTRPPSKSASTSRSANAPAHRVELVAALDQARRRLGVQIGAERDDEDVGVERAGVGLDALGVGIDRADRRLHELHAGLDEVAVGVAHLLGRALARTSRRAWRTRRRSRRSGR